MKKLLFVLVWALTVNLAQAQSEWSPGFNYQYRGDIITEACSVPYPKYNGYGQYIGTYQCFRTTVWHQEWRQGYVHLWNANTGQWYGEWRRGTFWYYTWNTYERRVS